MLIFYCTFHEILFLLIVKGGAINFDALHQLLYLLFAPPPAEASEIVQQGALDYSEFSQGVG